MSYDGQTGYKRYARLPLAVRATVALTITLAFLALPALADQWAYAHWFQAKIYDHDWAMALRAAGTFYVWLPVALAIWLVQRERNAAVAKKNTFLLLGAPALAGILCEVLKIVIRRLRPNVDHGAWAFRDWNVHDWWSSAGLATPSSHTMVAFAAATMMARMYPRARWVFYVIAWGCGVTRFLSHNHYLSDVTFGALLGWAVGWGVWMQWGPKTEATAAGSRKPEAG